MERVEERFIRYAKIDTQSCTPSETTPSTVKQFDLLKLLRSELEELGLTNVVLLKKVMYMQL